MFLQRLPTQVGRVCPMCGAPVLKVHSRVVHTAGKAHRPLSNGQSCCVFELAHDRNLSSASRLRWLGYILHHPLLCLVFGGSNVFVAFLRPCRTGTSPHWQGC
jgi:hypothetical protein